MQWNLPKSILGFRFWTFFLSIFKKEKYFCEKSDAKYASHHNGLKCIFQRKKMSA
jgi:hypothetical protein